MFSLPKATLNIFSPLLLKYTSLNFKIKTYFPLIFDFKGKEYVNVSELHLSVWYKISSSVFFMLKFNPCSLCVPPLKYLSASYLTPFESLYSYPPQFIVAITFDESNLQEIYL